MPKLVGFGSDGASVNTRKKESVKTLLQQENPWITFGWCVTHRLEQALKNSLKGTTFDDVNELILSIYLYKCSLKKLWQLKELAEIYSKSFEFVEGGYQPKGIWNQVDSTQDTCTWYNHQQACNISEDKSYKSEKKATFKGWLIKWTEAHIPILVCISVEVLAPAKILSKAFESENVMLFKWKVFWKDAKLNSPENSANRWTNFQL